MTDRERVAEVRASLARYLEGSRRGVNVPKAVTRQWLKLLTPEGK